MDYVIGAGAILDSAGSITPAALHAHVDAPLAARVQAAAIDFEGTHAGAPMRLLAVLAGADAAGFAQRVTAPLRAAESCTLADVLAVLAAAAGAPEVHLFAHWIPDEETVTGLYRRGVTLVLHPLESIQAASIVTGQRFRRVA